MNAFNALRSLAVLIALAIAAAAPAQLVASNVQNPRVGQPELDAMQEFFALTEDQNQLLRAAWDGYNQAHQATLKEYRSRNDALRDEARQTRDWQTLRDRLDESRVQFTQAVDALEADFFATAQSILTEEQAQEWDRYRREWRRRSRLHNGSGGGTERIDILSVLDTLELTESDEADIADTLEQYAVEMDAALEEREAAIKAVEDARGDFSDPEVRLAIQETIETLEARRQTVREINARYYEAVLAQLPESRREQFSIAYHSAAYPNIYVRTPVDEYYDTISELESLTDDQRETIDGAYEQYNTRMADINRRMVEILREAESARNRGAGRGREVQPAGTQGTDGPPRIAPGGGDGGGSRSLGQQIAEGGDPRINLMKEKHELMRETIGKFVAALDQEQLAQAPAPEIHPFGQRPDDPHDRTREIERERAPGPSGG